MQILQADLLLFDRGKYRLILYLQLVEALLRVWLSLRLSGAAPKHFVKESDSLSSLIRFR